MAQILKTRQTGSPSLDRFLKYCHRRGYPARSEIIYPGDPADTLYYLLEGSATVLMEDNEGHEIVLAYLNAGDFIGEMGLFAESQNRSVLVRTRTPCQVAEMSYVRLRELARTELADVYPELLFALAAQLTRRLLNTSRKVGHLAFMDVTGRIARALLDLATEPDAMTHPDGMQIRITRQELGRIVGCSREMAGRVLKNLEEQGLVSVKGKTIVVFGAR